MQFRVYGQDRISKEPRAPLDIEAETEEAARQQAFEMGMDVLQVEPLNLTSVQPAPSPPVVWDREADSRPALDVGRAWSRRRWLLVCLALVVLSVAGGSALGILLVRYSPANPASPSAPNASPVAAAPAAGVHLEEMKSGEELFALAGQRAQVFKFTGGDVQFWVELESNGQKQTIATFAADENPPGPDQTEEGYLLWVRSDPDDKGQEIWKLAHRRDLVTAQASATQISGPLTQLTLTQAKENRQSGSQSSSQTVQVWKGKSPNNVWTVATEAGSIPSPLPGDREVCLKQIKEERKLLGNMQAATGASALGLLGSPQGEPFVAASALVPDRLEGKLEAHTIRVMCKAAVRKGKAGEAGK